MTCITAIVARDCVVMGADSYSSNGASGITRRDPKLFVRDSMLFGCTSSWRMIQLLRHALAIPKHHPGVDTGHYMAVDFVNALRECFKSGGFRSEDASKGGDWGGTFLLGYRGQIFHIEDDFQVGQSTHSFDACGSGAQVALGAMFALTKEQNVDSSQLTEGEARDIVTHGLYAAEQFNPFVRAPMHVLTLDNITLDRS